MARPLRREPQGPATAISGAGIDVCSREPTCPGTLQFPISGGNVTVFKPGTVSPYVIGQVQHEGSGLSLTAGDTTVEIHNLNVDPGVSRVYGDVVVNGKVAASSAYIFKLDGRTLNPLQSGEGTATLEAPRSRSPRSPPRC